MNRLKQADGYQIANNTFSPIGYNELLGYDKQGNLNLLQRNTGTANLDNLTYSYTGNQISSISDSYGSKNQYTIKEYNNLYRSTDFSYDPNGNMTKDLDRKIVTIRYNILNLPDTVQFSNGNQIVNLYSADGRKLGTEYFTQVTDLAIPLTAGKTITQSYIPGTVNQNGKAYVDNKIYNTLNGFWTLSTLARISNTEGYYISYNSTPYSGYHYNRTDHLGNIREVWHAASKTTIQRTQYYPSGLPWATTTADNPSMQPYKYNGKEFDEMNGWDTYDYGARGYYPALGRFMTVDPHAEKYYSSSPYAYCGGNPVKFIDPNGMDWFVNNENGNVIFIRGVSELNNDLRDKYGLGSSKYENMGKDQMFGKDLKEIANRDVLTFDGPSFAEKFMNNQGYEKAERVKIEETKITTTDSGESGKITKDTHFDLIEKNKAITYTTPDKFDTKSNMSKKTDGDIYKNFVEIETVRYNLIKPAGQSSYNNAYYEEQCTGNNVNSAITGIGLIFDLLKLKR